MTKIIIPKKEIMIPTLKEIRTTYLEIIRHSCNVEYYLTRLKIKSLDPQRPHDIRGPKNKLEWKIISILAMQDRINEKILKKATREHTKGQYHHRMWNRYNEKATSQDMQLGAIDAICALSEPRKYLGGPHNYEQIKKIIQKNPEHKQQWLNTMLGMMKKIEKPRLEIITTTQIPNIGIKKEIYGQIMYRAKKAREMLKTKGYKI